MLNPSNAKLYDVVRQDQVCPRCGKPLEAQFVNGRKILVCGQPGECDYATDAPEDQQQRRRGAPTLPGLDWDSGMGGGC